MRLIGDVRQTTLYDKPLNIEDAQALVDLNLEHFRGGSLNFPRPPIQVVYTSTETLRRVRTYAVDARVIRLHRSGENMGSVIHELSHAFSPDDMHGLEYKRWHKRLLDLWEEQP